MEDSGAEAEAGCLLPLEWEAVEVYAPGSRDSVKGFHACGVPALREKKRDTPGWPQGRLGDCRLWRQ